MGVVIFSTPMMIWVFLLFLPNASLFCIALVVTVFCTWTWFDTNYRVGEEFLFFRSGPFRGKIPIESIKEITPQVRNWSGTRPALCFVFLQIRYNVYDDMFIAPKDEVSFIEDLRNKNPKITVKAPPAPQ